MVAYSFAAFPHELNFLFFLLVLGGSLILTSSIGLTLSLFMASDSFSCYLVLLTILVFFFSILSIYYEKLNYAFWAYLNFLLFVLVLFLTLLFFSCDIFFFYIFFELTVIPTFIVIIGWGYSVNRLQASFYIVVYMLFSSFPFLFSFLFFHGFGLSFMFFFGFYSNLVFIGSFWWFFLFVVFSVKLPVFFLHLWLPSAHVDAPLLGSIVLAGVLLNIGGFGLLSVSYLLFSFFHKFGWFLVPFALVGSFYAAIVCLRQSDINSLVAYSSIVHIGPVFICFFFLSYYSLLGSFLIIISHGLCSCALFFLLNFISKLLFTRSIFFLRGSISASAVFTFFWFCYCFFNIGCPPSFNFFSEFISIFSCLLYSQSFLLAFFSIIVIVGFYCVTLMASLSHGLPFFYFFPSFIFLNLSDLLVSFFLAFLLLFFFFFSFIFSC